MNQDKSSDKAKKRFDNRSDYISSRSHKAWKPSQPVKTFVPDSPLMQEARQLRLKRRFSQNFLINATVLKKIAMLQDLQPGDTVLEIGAGSGFLTGALLQTGAKVTAVELDSGMCWYLKKKFQKPLGLVPESDSEGPFVPTLRLVEGDFLKLEPSVMEIPVTGTEFSSLNQCPERFKVVGNLPYGITSKILFKLIGELEDVDHAWRSCISQLTFMVQKEVAERITAKPGEKAYNNLSIAMQMRCQARLEFIVPSRDFYPAPKVDSAIISLIPREHSLIPPEKIVAFSKLVQAAFAAKRKTLKNSLLLRKFATPEQIDAAFMQSGIDPKSRAEALSIQEFGALTDAFGIHPG